ncbi:MAG TPA: type IV toxin-antitoxin system AbiEi family antitoxin domain-containing protein [Acidimicrobiales bacterium]|jgi:hypothetical protein
MDWNVVNAAAAGQHGLISLRQIEEAGASRHQIARLIGSGVITRVHRSVFALVGSAPTFRRRALAAVLAGNVTAHISHMTALALWGLRRPTPIIEMVVTTDRRVRIDGVRCHRTISGDERDLTTIYGIPVTSAARSLIDCSARFGPKTLGLLVDRADRAGILTPEELQRCRAQFRGGPTRSVDVVDAVARERVCRQAGASEPEVGVFRAIAEGGLPPPEQNWTVLVGDTVMEFDLAYPAQHIVIDYDGWDTHRTRSDFDRDRARDRLLAVHGITALRVTSATNWVEFVDQLRVLLDRAA